MVKELGTFFEELVKEYLDIKEECEFVEVDYPFKITRQDYEDIEGKERQAHWSDIDVLGVKGNNVYLVSCREYIGTIEDVKRIIKQLDFAEKATKRKFPDKNTVKKIACIMKHKNCVFENVEVTYLKDMINELIGKIRGRGRRDQHVKYPFEWLIRGLDVIGFFIERDKARKIYGFPSRNYITSRSEMG